MTRELRIRCDTCGADLTLYRGKSYRLALSGELIVEEQPRNELCFSYTDPRTRIIVPAAHPQPRHFCDVNCLGRWAQVACAGPEKMTNNESEEALADNPEQSAVKTLQQVRDWVRRQACCQANVLPATNVLLWELTHLLDGLALPDLPFDKRPGAKYPGPIHTPVDKAPIVTPPSTEAANAPQ